MSQIKKLLIPLLILTLLYTSLPDMALAAGSGVSVSYNGSNDSAVVSAIRAAMVDRETEATVTYTKSMGSYRSKSALNSAVSEDLDAFTDQCLGLCQTGPGGNRKSTGGGLPFVERLWRLQPDRQQHRQRRRLFLRRGAGIQRYVCFYGHHTPSVITPPRHRRPRSPRKSMSSSRDSALPAALPITPNS